MSRKKIIIIAVLVALVGGGWYGYSEYTRGVKDLSYVEADVQINHDQLIQAFTSNEQQANSLYLDKIISVKGKLKNMEKDESGHYTLILGEEGSMSSVRCSMDSTHQQAADELQINAEVIIKGACTGFNADELLGSDVILNRCVIVK